VGLSTLLLFHSASTGSYTREIDLFDSQTGKWTTAQLSVARYTLAAASIGHIALFAGGETIVLLHVFLQKLRGGARMFVLAWLIPMLWFAPARIVVTVISFSLTQAPGVTGDSFSDAVDLYNGATGTWSTAQLSVARGYLTSTSVGNMAIFVGGAISSVLSVFWL
jgi:hypothetical protein